MYLKKEQIYETFVKLAKSQGTYGRLLEHLGELDLEDFNEVMQKLEDQKFNDVVDLIIFVEG